MILVKKLVIYIKKIKNFLKRCFDYEFLYGGGPIQLSLAQYISENNIEDRFNKLIRNLDKESIETLCLILTRLQKIYTNQDCRIFDITQKEIERLSLVKNSFQPLLITKESDKKDGIWYIYPYFLPTSQFEISVFLEHHGINKFKNLQRIKDKNIIDVGGFVGDSAMIFELYTNKKVYTFEASKVNYQKILQTIKLNNLTKVIPINKGLGSKSEKLLMQADAGGSSSFIYGNKKTEEVDIITLDSYVEEKNLEVGLIKVDIEGFEMEFLKGALKTIQTQKPALIISIYHSIDDFFDIKPFIESLNLGYKIQIFKPIDHCVQEETCILCECDC